MHEYDQLLSPAAYATPSIMHASSRALRHVNVTTLRLQGMKSFGLGVELLRAINASHASDDRDDDASREWTTLVAMLRRIDGGCNLASRWRLLDRYHQRLSVDTHGSERIAAPHDDHDHAHRLAAHGFSLARD